VAKRVQHVAPNNVAICCVDMLLSFGRGFSHHHFLMGFNHLSGTALQNKGIVVQLPRIDICF